MHETITAFTLSRHLLVGNPHCLSGDAPGAIILRQVLRRSCHVQGGQRAFLRQVGFCAEHAPLAAALQPGRFPLSTRSLEGPPRMLGMRRLRCDRMLSETGPPFSPDVFLSRHPRRVDEDSPGLSPFPFFAFPERESYNAPLLAGVRLESAGGRREGANG